MIVTVNYSMFVSNNHQGGEGDWTKGSVALNVDDDLTLEQVKIVVNNKLVDIKNETPFRDYSNIFADKIEVYFND